MAPRKQTNRSGLDTSKPATTPKSVDKTEKSLADVSVGAANPKPGELAAIGETTAKLQEREVALGIRETEISNRETALADREKAMDDREKAIDDRASALDIREAAIANLEQAKTLEPIERGEHIQIASKNAKGHYRGGMLHPKGGHVVAVALFSEEQLEQLFNDDQLVIEMMEDEAEEPA